MMKETRNACKILLEKRPGKLPLGKPRKKMEVDIKKCCEYGRWPGITGLCTDWVETLGSASIVP